MFKPQGIIPPIITPFREDGSIDYDVYCEMIEHFIASGVHGIFPMGTTGEFYAVNDEEYRKLLQVTVEAVHGRVDIYAGANDITTRGVIQKIRICEEIEGIDAVSVLTPMFISQTQEEIYTHYKTIAASTRIPIIIYYNKPKTKVTVMPQTIGKLAQIDNIVGVKDSTGDFSNTMEYLRITKDISDFSVLVGRDTLIYAGLCAGAAGSIASCANMAPKLVVEIYKRYMAGDLKGSLEAQQQLNPLRFACNMGTFPAAIKEGLVQQGFPVGKCLAPILELTQQEKDNLHSIMLRIGLIT